MKGKTIRRARRNPQAGFSLIELLLAGLVLTICVVGLMGMILTAILLNNRNKHDSTFTMLAGAVIEQVNSIVVGTGTASLSDCYGNNFPIDTAPGGANAQGGIGTDIDFTQAGPPAGYQMTYVVASPCNQNGTFVAAYDVRWRVDYIGQSAGTPTHSFLVTVGAKQSGGAIQGTGQGLRFALPMNLKVVLGRPE